MSDIMVLNGTSSSGKSTLAKTLQRQLTDAPFLHAGIDNYIFMLPKQYLNPPLWNMVFTYTYKNGTIQSIQTGPFGFQLMTGMHKSIAALADAGLNIIIDHVLLERVWLHEMGSLYRDCRVWFIGVRCPLDVLEQRERGRKDRTLGQARAQVDVVHAGMVYDFEVDTSKLSPEACTERIIQHMRDNPQPQGFRRSLAPSLP